MKRTELLLTAILLPLDFVLVVLAGITSYHIRFTSQLSGIIPVVFQMPFSAYIQSLLLIAGVWLAIFIFAGLYNISQERRLKNELKKVIIACSLGLVSVVVYIFFFRDLFSSRFIVLAGWLLAMLYIGTSRLLISGLRNLLYRHGIGVRQVVIVGNSKTSEVLIKQFSTKARLGYKVVKRLDQFGLEEVAELSKLISYKEVDEIIQADPNLSKAEMLRLYDFADEHHIVFKYVADLLDTKVLRVEVNELAGLPVAEVKKTPLDGWGRILKRLFDLLVSFVLLIVLSPVLVVIAILIKLDSKGPVFFAELDDGQPLQRIGQSGKPFRYLKFRSMLPRSDSLRYTELSDRNLRSDSPLVKIKDDPRVTKVGRFIRRFSLDELPELWLVFLGKMSLVGPRPHLPEEVAKYKSHHKKALTIKPGITGLAQVSGRSDLSFEEEVKLDTYYIEHWSLWLDLIILFKTPLAVLRPRQAY